MMISRIDSGSQTYATGGVESGSVSTAASTLVATTANDEAGMLPLPDPLSSMATGGDLLAELTALLTRASQNDRDMAREAGRAEDILRTRQEHAKISFMHEQADDIRAGAWAAGLAEIGQGVCQIGAGTIDCEAGKLDWNDVSLAMSKGFAAAGTTIGGQYKAMEKLDQAGAEEAGANADRAGRGAKEANDAAESARDLLKKIISFYGEMLGAQSAAMSAATAGRA